MRIIASLRDSGFYSSLVTAIMLLCLARTARCDGAKSVAFEKNYISSDFIVYAAAAADLDGDQDTDVVFGSIDTSSIVWLENREATNPSFIRHVIDFQAILIKSIKTVDLDSDGDLDFVAADNKSNTVSCYENDGSMPPKFTKRIIDDADTSPTDIAVTDMNHDGHLDVVLVSDGAPNVVWLESDGTRIPSFRRHIMSMDLGGADSVEAADVNQDGAVDVIVSSTLKNKVVIFYSTGGITPAFSWVILTNSLSGARKVGAADFNGDGETDIYAYGIDYSTFSPHSELDLFLNDGAKSPVFMKNVVFSGYGGSGASYSAADFDLDGRIDLCGYETLMRNLGGVIPDFARLPVPGFAPSPLCIANIDDDAYPDIIGNFQELVWERNLIRKTVELSPINHSPSPGRTVSLAPRLAITIPDYWTTTTLLRTQYQISTNSNFSTQTYDSDCTGSVHQIFVPSKYFSINTTYYWRARLKFTDGYTPWSQVTSFKTAAQKVTVKNMPGDGFITIQEAIDAATTGSEIIVPYALYTEHVNFKGKNLNLHSEDPLNDDIVAGTIIDGNWNGSVVMFSGKEDKTCRLAGFTIQHGWGTYGGGVLGNNASPLIEHNVIRWNTATIDKAGFGGGGGISHCHGIIQNNQISENAAQYGYGGGLYICQGEIRYNMITGNTQKNANYAGLDNYGRGGGGLYSCTNVHNNQIMYNEAAALGGGLSNCGPVYANVIQGNKINNDHGGGGGLFECSDVDENLIVSNEARGTFSIGGGMYLCGFWDHKEHSNNTFVKNIAYSCAAAGTCATMINSIIWDNYTYGDGVDFMGTAANYCCIEGGAFGSHIMNVDPQFVNAAAGDYRLKATSPCIDAGEKTSSTLDLVYARRGTRVVGGRGDGSNYDIGAYEYMPADIVIYKPAVKTYVAVGEKVQVYGWSYTPSTGGSVSVQLWQSGKLVKTLGTASIVFGYFDKKFTIPQLSAGTYQVRVVSVTTPTIYAMSSGSLVVRSKNAVRRGGWELYK